MKITHEGKRYNSEKCRDIANIDLYSYSNNYAGETTLMIASDGIFILHTYSNGQDCHIDDDICVLSLDEARAWLQENNADMDDDEEKIAIECGLIEVIE